MKKILKRLLLITIFMLFPAVVLASGNITASPSYLTVEVGSTKTFTITATNTIGDVAISSSNTNVATVNTSEWGTGMVDEGQTKSGTITVTGVSEGTATITLTLDAATFDSEDLSGQKRTISVTVIAKQAPSTNNNTGTTNSTTNNNVNTTTNNKSNNNNLKEISAVGFSLVKVDNNNYTLSVGQDIDKININATAEDEKARVTGTGEHTLEYGDNTIEIVITSESGFQNKVYIKVTRRENYSLEDLESLLKNNDTKEINIVLSEDSVLTKEHLSMIKSSKKIVNLSYYEEDILKYTWIIDGSKLKNVEDINTKLTYSLDNQRDIAKLANYADGLIVNILSKGSLDGVKLKLYVNNKYLDEDRINVYFYKNGSDKLELVNEELSVKDGYIVFDVNDAGDYFLTMSKVYDASIVNHTTKNNIVLPVLILIVTGLVVAICIVYKKKFLVKKVNTDIINDSNRF